MPAPELPLRGGQMSSVLRVGDTVRRGTGPWSPAVHRLLRHLEAVGFEGASRFLGIDANGREVLTYIPGDAGFFSAERTVPPNLWADQILVEAARLLRRFHDVTTDFVLPAGVQWLPPWPNPTPHEVICHNDFAPYNCIFRGGQLIGMIDLDGAAPGPRTWDLAYAAYTFVPLSTDERCRAVGWREPPDRARRLRLICDAYGLADRSGFTTTLEERVRAVGAMVRVLADGGDVRYQRKIDEGHLDGYEADAAYLREHRHALQAALG